MQDLTTGEMKPLEGLKEIPKMDLMEKLKTLQASKDAAVPRRENQGPVFEVGEILEIRGGKFRVHAITEKRIYLDSLPSK